MAKAKDKSIGEVIKRYRILKGLTQEKLADILNVSYQTVQKYEYDKTTPPLAKLAHISKILEIPHEAFFIDSVRNDLLQKMDGDLVKNHELVTLIKEHPELQEIVRFYAKNKTNLKAIDIVKLLKDISNIPKNKREAFLDVINKVLHSLR